MDWEKIADTDFIWKDGDYILRVEKMSNNWWWWNISYKKEEIAFCFDYPRTTNELEAKLLAEITFLKHKYENKTFAKMA